MSACAAWWALWTSQSWVRACDRRVLTAVNNVGRSHDMPVPFVETPSAEMKEIVDINIVATLGVTRLIAPRLVQRCVRRRNAY